MSGRCLFQGGGRSVSAGSDNSWLSKVYLRQSVARHPLDRARSADSAADAEHRDWMPDANNSRWGWGDRMRHRRPATE